MGDVKRFEEICRAMSDPGFYPHPVAGVERRDSHISAVFLTGGWVYKLKKPFDFGFLDYTGLDSRRKMCEREVRLNQRLSSGIYDGVVEIRESGGRFHLGGPGSVVEYAVRMKQLPDDASLSNLIASGAVGPGEMDRLGRRLGDFYLLGEQSPEISKYGLPEAISLNTEENYRQVEPFVGTLIKEDPLDFIREAGRGFFRDRSHLFGRRIAEGRILDGHGDIRAEHVYFADGIQIIDCIEFNDRFRYGDAAADLAFLHMDIERLGRPEFAVAVLSGYIEKSRDFGIYSVLDFYSCYRAIVKMKVSCLTWSELDDGPRRAKMKARAAQYLDLAFHYAVRFSRPAIWVFCGLPGTGKSTLAEKIADHLSIPLLRSDLVRKDLPEYGAHPGGPAPLGEGVYRPELRSRVYAQMLARAQDELKQGRSVVLDATFSSRKWRREALRLAEDLDSGIVFFECAASENTLLNRLGRRKTGESASSDARPEHLAGLADEFDPIDELSPEFHARIETERHAPDELLVRVLANAYEMKRTQVEEAVERLQ